MVNFHKRGAWNKKEEEKNYVEKESANRKRRRTAKGEI
jgi:hypothetical protein